jgi:hypothetical protein
VTATARCPGRDRPAGPRRGHPASSRGGGPPGPGGGGAPRRQPAAARPYPGPGHLGRRRPRRHRAPAPARPGGRAGFAHRAGAPRARGAGGDLDRVVTHPPDTARGFPIGRLPAVGGSAQTLDLPARRAGAALRAGRRRPPALRPEGGHRLVGTPAPRVDLPAKTSGAAVFTTDVHLPGMLHGAVATPPRPGAVPGRAGPDLDRGLHGGRGGRAPRGHRAAGGRARAAGPRGPGRRTGRRTAPHGGVPHADGRGRPAGAAGRGRRRHPVRGDRVRLHAGPGLLRAGVARVLRRRPSGVRVVVPYVGGSFGRKPGHLGDPAADAARLSAATGRPVRLAWTRRRSCSTGPGARRATTSRTRPSARRPAPVAAALANAALALTGHRLRGLPLRLPGGIGGWVPPESRSPDA